jgi:hypothetical protein
MHAPLGVASWPRCDGERGVLGQHPPLALLYGSPRRERGHGCAEYVLRGFHVHAETAILRGRETGVCVADETRQRGVDAVYVRFRDRPAPWGHRFVSETLGELLNAAPCPVVILHMPHTTSR